MGKNRYFEMRPITKTTGPLSNSFNLAVKASTKGIGYPMPERH